MRVAIVQGTRPEIIKNYGIVKALAERGTPFEVLHTNQHSAAAMSGAIYAELGYAPSRVLPQPYRLGTAIDWLQTTFVRDRIDHVIVNGDTAASIAGALAALYLDIPVSHIEAGLRSGDVDMLEERNRVMVDAIAALLFAYTELEHKLLAHTPEVRGRIFTLGNTTIDVLHDFAAQLDGRPRDGRYLLATLHRKELTDSRERLLTVFRALARAAETHCDVVFPMHPRTRDAARRHGISLRALGAVHVLDPVGTFESLRLQKYASAVLTDSGCIQEEAYLLRVPCITIRENTERHLTVRHGANVVVGFDPGTILAATQWALTVGHSSWPDIYGPPGASRRIVEAIAREPASIDKPVKPPLSRPDSAMLQ